MLTNFIEEELKKEYKIEDKGNYEVKTPYYNQLLSSKSENNKEYLFPIEIRKKVIKIIKLPFNVVFAIGREVKDVVKWMIAVR